MGRGNEQGRKVEAPGVANVPPRGDAPSMLCAARAVIGDLFSALAVRPLCLSLYTKSSRDCVCVSPFKRREPAPLTGMFLIRGDWTKSPVTTSSEWVVFQENDQ